MKTLWVILRIGVTIFGGICAAIIAVGAVWVTLDLIFGH